MLSVMLLDLGYSVMGVAKNFDEAFSHLNLTKPNLCFIDINLEHEKNGFDVAEELQKRGISYVFLTSYSDKSTISKAAQLKPEAYIVKPFSSIDLLTTIEIVKGKSKLAESTNDLITIKESNLNFKVNINDILWIKSDNVYVEIKTKADSYLVRSSLDKFVEEINNPIIFKTHRSYAVNFKEVNAVSGQFLLVAGEKIPISRKFRDEIHERFKF